jgi:hypothetical protein
LAKAHHGTPVGAVHIALAKERDGARSASSNGVLHPLTAVESDRRVTVEYILPADDA